MTEFINWLSFGFSEMCVHYNPININYVGLGIIFSGKRYQQQLLAAHKKDDMGYRPIDFLNSVVGGRHGGNFTGVNITHGHHGGNYITPALLIVAKSAYDKYKPHSEEM